MKTQDELNTFLKNTSWRPVSRDSTHSVLVSKTRVKFESWNGKWVIKFPHGEDDPILSVMNSAARAVQILRSIHSDDPHYSNVFHIEGYRLKLVYDNTAPKYKDIKPQMIYVYMTALGLEVTMIGAHDGLQRVSLTNMPEYPLIREEFMMTEQYAVQQPRIALPFEQECAIFQFLGVSREVFIAPYAGKQLISNRMLIATSILDIYRLTRNIILDGHERGIFFRDNVRHRPRVVLAKIGYVYHRNVFESIVFFNKPNVQAMYARSWDKYSNPQYEDPAVAMIKTLLYLEFQMQPFQFDTSLDVLTRKHQGLDVITNDYLRPDMMEVLHVFRHNQWTLTVPALETIVLILDRCKTNKVDHLTFNLSFIKEAQALICNNINALDDLIQNQIPSYSLQLNQSTTQSPTVSAAQTEDESDWMMPFFLENASQDDTSRQQSYSPISIFTASSHNASHDKITGKKRSHEVAHAVLPVNDEKPDKLAL
jgi:hypothetical protein